MCGFQNPCPFLMAQILGLEQGGTPIQCLVPPGSILKNFAMKDQCNPHHFLFLILHGMLQYITCVPPRPACSRRGLIFRSKIKLKGNVSAKKNEAALRCTG